MRQGDQSRRVRRSFGAASGAAVFREWPLWLGQAPRLGPRRCGPGFLSCFVFGFSSFFPRSGGGLFGWARLLVQVLARCGLVFLSFVFASSFLSLMGWSPGRCPAEAGHPPRRPLARRGLPGRRRYNRCNLLALLASPLLHRPLGPPAEVRRPKLAPGCGPGGEVLRFWLAN